MRVLPGMVVLQPIDAIEAKKAALAAAEYKGPVYIRISKQETPLITTEQTPFEIGKSYVLVEGKDLTLLSSGPIIFEALQAARDLKTKHNISVEVVSCPTIKPLDETVLLESVKKTGKVATLEEHQIIGGLGSAVSELISENYPVKLIRLGMKDRFGESGGYKELKDKYGLSSHNIVEEVIKFINGQ
jgi:transketolase